MFEWFAENTLNAVFGAALGLGLVYSIVLIFFQGMDGAFDGLGDFDVDFDADAAADATSISFLAVAVFISAFGAFGLAARGIFDAGTAISIIVAAIGGFIFGGLAQAFFIYVLSPTTNSMFSQASLVGQVAEVTIPIPDDGTGQITLVTQGSRVTYSARAYNQQTIPRGREVRIEKIIGSVATVIPIEDLQL
ncbi:MAG: hypothetical protein GYB66_13595 [Chloroflexi bacterium]|nr:hypothetical protein [Chloroflexota bacterium]